MQNYIVINVLKGSVHLYKDLNRIRKFVLYSRKISSNIQKCFLILQNSFRIFPSVSNLWYKNSWKETERIVKEWKTFGNIRKYFVRVQYINVIWTFLSRLKLPYFHQFLWLQFDTCIIFQKELLFLKKIKIGNFLTWLFLYFHQFIWLQFDQLMIL